MALSKLAVMMLQIMTGMFIIQGWPKMPNNHQQALELATGQGQDALPMPLYKGKKQRAPHPFLR